MEHIRIKPTKIISEPGGVEIDISKKKGTTMTGVLSVKKYEGGVSIRMRKQGVLHLSRDYAANLVMIIKEYNPGIYSLWELNYIREKFKYDKEVVEFVDRIRKREVSVEEMEEIRKQNIVKDKVLTRMEG